MVKIKHITIVFMFLSCTVYCIDNKINRGCKVIRGSENSNLLSGNIPKPDDKYYYFQGTSQPSPDQQSAIESSRDDAILQVSSSFTTKVDMKSLETVNSFLDDSNVMSSNINQKSISKIQTEGLIQGLKQKEVVVKECVDNKRNTYYESEVLYTIPNKLYEDGLVRAMDSAIRYADFVSKISSQSNYQTSIYYTAFVDNPHDINLSVHTKIAKTISLGNSEVQDIFVDFLANNTQKESILYLTKHAVCYSIRKSEIEKFMVNTAISKITSLINDIQNINITKNGDKYRKTLSAVDDLSTSYATFFNQNKSQFFQKIYPDGSWNSVKKQIEDTISRKESITIGINVVTDDMNIANSIKTKILNKLREDSVKATLKNGQDNDFSIIVEVKSKKSERTGLFYTNVQISLEKDDEVLAVMNLKQEGSVIANESNNIENLVKNTSKWDFSDFERIMMDYK